MAKVRKFFADNAVKIGVGDGVVFMSITAQLTVAHIKAMGDAYMSVLQERDSVVGFAHIAVVATGGWDPIKPAAADMLKSLGKRLAVSGLVFSEEGMRGMVIRTAIRGINVMLRGTQLRSFTTVEEGARELAPLASTALGRKVSESELLGAMTEVATYH